MDDRFIYGSQYLRGMTPPRKDWASDMANMKKLHFNIIRAWLVWGVLEPEEGKIDFDYIDEFLDLAGPNDLKVILLFHMHGCPEWAIKKYPEFWYVNEKGEKFEPCPRSNTPSGGWPGLCPDNKKVQELEANFISRIVRHVADRKEVIYWEPVNEPHMWVDISRSPVGTYCCCEASRSAFREWLKRKYKDLSKLENAWGRRLDCWESVRPPTWKFGFSDWSDWRTFSAENIAQLVSRRAEIIRQNTSTAVIAHAWGGGSILCPELGSMAFDDWKNAKDLKIWGCSAFPSSAEQLPNIGLSMDATRSAAAGKEFWQAELGTGDLGGGLHRTGRTTPETFALWCWEAVAHGISGLMFWQYRKEANGAEMGCYGLTDYAGRSTDVGEMAGLIGKTLSEHGRLFKKAKPLPADTAIIFSYQSYITEWSQFRNCNMSCDSMSGYYRFFWERNIPVDIIHEEEMSSGKLSKYKLIVLPMPLALPEGAGNILTQYVKEGGTVFSDPYLCFFTPGKSMSAEVPGQGMSDLFGCREEDVSTKNKNVELILRNGEKIPLQGTHFKAKWTVLEGASAIAKYPDGTSAIVSKNFGKGKAIISGVNLGLANSLKTAIGDDILREKSMHTDRNADRLLQEIINPAPAVEAPSGVRVHIMQTPENKIILIALNMKQEKVSGKINLTGLKKNGKYSSLISGEKGIFEHSELQADFRPHEAKVMILE